MVKKEKFIISRSFEGMFKEFWEAVDGKKQSIEPHVVRSNSIEALTTNMTKNRLQVSVGKSAGSRPTAQT